MKWFVGLVVGLLAVPAVAQTKRTIEIPQPRYAPTHPGASHSAGAPAAAEHGGGTRGHEDLAHVGTVHQKLRPPELLAEALSTPQDAFREGRHWPLVDVLTRAGDRQQQLAMTQLYWKLAGAQADYHFARDLSHRLWKATERHADQPAVLSARHSVEAAIDDAEVAVVAAQHELAQLMRLRSDEALPLAVDRPHVGEYKTHFESLFSGRTPPPRLRLTNRALPVRRKAIDVHGEAIIASQDAVDASIEDYERRTADLTTLLAAFEELGHQRRAFVAAVRDYNQDIAEYALNVAAPGANGDRLVAMLIKTPINHRAVADAPAARDRTFRDEQPAYEERGAAPPPAADYRSAPTDDYRSAPPADYRSAPPPADYRSVPRDDYRSAPRDDYRSSEAQPARGEARMDQAVMPAVDESPATFGTVENAGAEEPVDEPAGPDPFTGRRETRKPAHNEGAAAGAAAHDAAADVDRGEYSGLWHLSPALRAQKLAGILHWWERTLPPESGEPTTLVSVLKRTDSSRHKAAIDAYWRAREAAARYQIYGAAGDHLTPLASAALRSREEPGGVAAMLRLQAARLGLHAALLDSHVELLAAQWDLAMAAGANLDQPWLLPTTVPHAGRYRLPPQRASLGSANRWADNLSPLQRSLQERAEAVVFADAARAEASHAAGATPAGLSLALARVYRQTRETEAFLHTQTEYNLAIADFALGTLPPMTPVEQLVARLVIARSSKEGA